MDLCLRGSQINLVARQKPKPKCSSQTNLNRTPPFARPRSATCLHKRSRSPFLYRPQSADPKFGRSADSSCGHYCDENDFPGVKFYKNNKRFQSVSSSNLLKILLDEPIKRSWLCHGDGSSPDNQSNQSELSSYRKTGSCSSLHKRMCTESASSLEPDNERAINSSLHANVARQNYTSSDMSDGKKERASLPFNGGKAQISDYWVTIGSNKTSTESTTQLLKVTKPDLPGRVSFCKSSTANDLDSSDCDNDKQEQYTQLAGTENETRPDSISAPGPLTLPGFSHSHCESPKREAATAPLSSAQPAATANSISSAGLKKTVHFGTAGAEGVYAETYEYPKCPSENCSCSTRSSSTASIQESLDSKCACALPTCKFISELTTISDMKELEIPELLLESETDDKFKPKIRRAIEEESAVIRDYKNAVGEQLENSIVKNILEEECCKTIVSSSLNNIELPTYLEKYSAPVKTDVNLDKQNNLSEARHATTYKSPTKRNLMETASNGLIKTDNLEKNLGGQPAYKSSAESVINNYLKVVASAANITKKKDNKPDVELAVYKKKKTNGNGSSIKSKVTSVSTVERGKLKKSISYGNLREDSNLSEFQLDKVDSWMSIHQDALATKSLEKSDSFENGYEKLKKDALDFLLDVEEGEHPESISEVSTKSEEHSQDDSTYDEIVSVIKEIEEDKKKDNLAERASNETELMLNTRVDSSLSLPIKAVEVTAPLHSPDKYKDILNYLDNVEDSCDKALLETRRSIPESNRSEVEFIVEPDVVEDVPKLSDLLMLPNHQLARRVVALSLRANELANAVHLSKEHVFKIRAEKQKCVRTEKANTVTRLRDQKKHYETIVKRHQCFIEQLLKDKGSLCEKVAALTRRLESQNQAWEHKLTTEVARVKETTLAGEKIRRERWVRENTKKIKELTVKGLETEINRMNSTHEQEVAELKRAHHQQLFAALEEARTKHEQIENGIRESCAQDREVIIEKERTAIRERFERQLEEEHKSFDEQRQKLCEEFAAERERLQNELRGKEAEYQKRREEVLRDKERELGETIAELQEKMCRQDEKYQNRINTIEKQYEADFEIWKREYENSCKMAQAEKENTIRQHYRTERDRQIDAIVSRMDAESLKNAEEFETKVIRLKEKYEKDLQEVESVEKSLREKYTETRGKLAEADAEVRNAQAEIKQLQIELDHSKKMCDDFLMERDQVRENLRSEIQAEVVTLKTERDNEIQKIYKRVQQAIEKKDVTIDILQKENGSLRERCLKLEAVIRQQRKDYCVK